MSRPIKLRKRYPKGTQMKLISVDTLNALMDQKDCTGARLARSCGKSEAFISQLRRGKKPSCKDDTARYIAEALDVPLTLLFEPRPPRVTTRIVKPQVTRCQAVAA